MTTTGDDDQRQTLRLLWHYPAHEARATDPHYRVFEATRRRLRASTLWRCAVRGCTNTDLEVHHSKVEFALQNGIDLGEFNAEYGLDLNAAQFHDFIQREGNAEVICALHHRGVLGVHVLPEPAWRALRVWKDDLPPPAIVERGQPEDRGPR